MNDQTTAGERLRDAVVAEQPLQMVGAINAYCALLAEHAGFRALYLSGAGVANASYGLPDLGLTTLDNVLEDVRRITAVTSLPLLVDVDTGFDDISATVERLIAAGAAGMHVEDQVSNKKCGHLPGKALVSTEEMVERLTTAIATRDNCDPSFMIMARTDAVAVEGATGARQRMERYLQAGADMLFPEALSELSQYRQITDVFNVPVLANITEFGKTPLFDLDQLKSVGVAIALYPLSAFRLMSAAAWEGYNAIRSDGTQASMVEKMQRRDELYRHLDYDAHAEALADRQNRERRDDDER